MDEKLETKDVWFAGAIALKAAVDPELLVKDTMSVVTFVFPLTRAVGDAGEAYVKNELVVRARDYATVVKQLRTALFQAKEMVGRGSTGGAR